MPRAPKNSPDRPEKSETENHYLALVRHYLQKRVAVYTTLWDRQEASIPSAATDGTQIVTQCIGNWLW